MRDLPGHDHSFVFDADFLGPVSAWNWPAVTSFSRRLNRYIHKLAIAKIGSYAVLPFAAQLKKSGIPLGQVPID